jgi:hypothetical protein
MSILLKLLENKETETLALLPEVVSGFKIRPLRLILLKNWRTVLGFYLNLPESFRP